MKNLSVAILDDDEFILHVARSMLERLGVEKIVTYGSAKQALSGLNLFDDRQILLCDLNMPEIDGVEVIRILGQKHFAGAIIVLSGEDSRTLKTVVSMGRAYHLRLIGALEKPLRLVDLKQMFALIEPDVEPDFYADTELTAAELDAEMEQAVTPYFQPQVNVVTREIVGVETLARWKRPDGSILGPASFIPLAEETLLIDRVSDLVLAKSLRQWRQWYDAGIDLSISVNVSMHSLNRIDFPDELISQIQASGVPLDRLVLEITESHLAQDLRIALDVLTRLCLKRIRLSVDDFGTAYSNMEKLLMVPFTELKIDRSFVHGSATNPSYQAILKSSCDLARQLGMNIVAEGVENQEDWDCVAGLKYDLIQGYYIARPMPGEVLIDWLTNWKAETSGSGI
ncbi:MAG: EAL domain-containing response regulator [Gammaproteobacteria bacterium]